MCQRSNRRRGNRAPLAVAAQRANVPLRSFSIALHVGIDLKERTASQSTGRFQPSDTALMGSKLACQAPLMLTEGELQRCAVEKDAESVANLNRCEV